ncbi:MAG TPA: reverse transcriptase family protein [Polyangiaceae bacterium]|nr:reverse transcriptase family protein [Polyangiaceae bacterium]
MKYRSLLARALAEAFAVGPWQAAPLRELAGQVLGAEPSWVAPLVRAVRGKFSSPAEGEEGVLRVAAFIETRDVFQEAFHGRERPHIQRWLFRPPAMGPSRWPVPPASTLVELAQLLEVDAGQLEWLADTRRFLRRATSPRLGHYHRVWMPKRNGGHRLIERPKPLLKEVQQRVLHRILDAIPPHECAEGFVRGHSPLSHAARHTGSAALLCLDLEDFFTSIAYGRIMRVFRSAGYPLLVARTLASLCTSALPSTELSKMPRPALASDVPRHQRLRRNALQQHLPQGAPTSPALANLCAFRLDLRLASAARSIGARYSRYADDLAFSGGPDFARRARDFAALAAGIALDENFDVNFRKTRVLRRATRQQLCGVVVNAHPNVPRDDYDRLKAILTNCQRHGVANQNRDGHADFRSHLRGRVAWVTAVAPARGAKLLQIFRSIDWDSAG